MIRKLTIIAILMTVTALIAACGTVAIPAYEQDETAVSVARTSTLESLLTEGAIIPTNTPTVTPSPTVDFEATAAAEQATLDAEASITAQFEATVAFEAQATADAQAEIDAQATIDAMPTPIGQSDPLFEAIAAADIANGELIFTALSAPPCSTCHLADSEAMMVGPGQYNLLARSAERIENGTIDDVGPYTYIYNSIINPGDHIVETYANAMPDVYETSLSEEQLYDLVAYLVSLGD